MLPYWILFAVFLAGTLQTLRAGERSQILFIVACFGVALMIGLRFRVGGDWGAYLDMFSDVALLDLAGAMSQGDPGYSLINWVGAQLGLQVWFTNLVCGCIFMAGFGRLAMKEPNPWLAILVAVPYLIIVVAMGYTRQAAAMGVIAFGLAGATERGVIRLALYVLVAATLHKTAALALPIIAVPLMRSNVVYGAVGAVASLGIYYLLLSQSVDKLVTNYVEGEYDSSGAFLRVAMDVLAGLVMIVYRKRMGFASFAQSYWTTCAALSVAALGALFVFSASSGVDRLALFLIPLQMVVFARLPYALGSHGRPNLQVLGGVIAYCALVQFVWLNFADNAFAWIPYSTVIGNM